MKKNREALTYRTMANEDNERREPNVVQPDREALRKELVDRFARRLMMSTSSSFVGYGVQAFVLTEVVPTAFLWSWVGAMAVGEVVNGTLSVLLKRSLDQPARRERLRRILVVGLAFTGSVWGSVVLLPGVAGNPDILIIQEVFLAIIGILSIQNLSFVPSCHVAFGIGMAIPTTWAGLVEHSIPFAFGLGAVSLLAIALLYGWTTRKLVVESIATHLVNEQVTAELKRSHHNLVEALDQLDRQASVDYLTQCLNRRAMTRAMERELSRCQRDGTTLGLIMLDIDHFKAVNDQYGHRAGDSVLISLVAILRQQLRPTDLLARWGGEEFLFLLTRVDDEALLQKAEAMRQLIERSPTRVADATIHVTVSLGVATYRHGQTVEDLVEASDRALYKAKVAGRNRAAV